MALVSPSGTFAFGTDAGEAATGRDLGTLRQTVGFSSQQNTWMYKFTKRSGPAVPHDINAFRFAVDTSPFAFKQSVSEAIHSGLIYEWITFVTSSSKGQVGVSNSVTDPIRLYYRNKPLRSRGRNYRGPIGSGLQRGI